MSDYAHLAMCADVLDDLERTRIANENRLRSLAEFGLEGSKDYERLRGIVDGIAALEHTATLDLKRAVRSTPLGKFIRDAKGIGEKQGARLLAATGDPYWHPNFERPRMVSELWAYCGMHVVNGEAPRRRKGQKSNWSDVARMRCFLIATSIVKAGGPYREVYDAAREKYADAVHSQPCVRCGPSGKPAPEGSALNPGHQHARALRAVSKAVLRDLWVASRDAHAASAIPTQTSGDGHTRCEAHGTSTAA